ncbi:MAG: hypothetical protein Q4C68_01025, partial [Moraxella sp.]|nr:hypothetical protein [Moraxella sp.]
DYARILRLLEQIDVAPTPITLSLRADIEQDGRANSHHIQAGIDQRVWVNGSYQNTSYQAQQNSHYQVRGITGAPMRISQNTLIQLINQSQTLISSPYGTPIVIRLTNHHWLTLSDGFSAQATPLPDGTFRLSINQSAQLGNSQQTTQSTLVVPKGHWTQLGWIEQQTSHRGTGTYQSQTTQLPIWVKLD